MATYYISPTGNDTTGNGSSGNPWLTLSKAVTASASGDTIICKDGTYTWANQTFATGRTVQAENSGLAIFDASAGAVTWTFSANAQSTISGIVFQNASLGYENGFSSSSAADTTFSRCVFRDISLYGGFNNYGLAIHQYSVTSTIRFTNCLFYDISVGSGTQSQSALFMGHAGYGVLYLTNCTIWLNATGATAIAAVIVRYGAATVKNCIVYAAASTQFYTPYYANNVPTVTYTCTYQMTSVPAGTGNIASDPLFIDAANGNFRLRPTSPCLNTGVAT